MTEKQMKQTGVAGLEQSLPSSWYRSADVFALEKERIFCREWICVAREEELAAPGDHRVLDVLGESVIVVRNREGRLRAIEHAYRTALDRDEVLTATPHARAPLIADHPPDWEMEPDLAAHLPGLSRWLRRRSGHTRHKASREILSRSVTS